MDVSKKSMIMIVVLDGLDGVLFFDGLSFNPQKNIFFFKKKKKKIEKKNENFPFTILDIIIKI